MHIINVLIYIFKYKLALPQTCLPTKAGAHKVGIYFYVIECQHKNVLVKRLRP